MQFDSVAPALLYLPKLIPDLAFTDFRRECWGNEHSGQENLPFTS